MRQFDITGMSCAACVARVEKAVQKVEGIDVVSVNLLTNSMGVEGEASDEDIINAVIAAGYGACVKGKQASGKSEEQEDKETTALKNRLVNSLIFLIILMYFSMGHMMLGLPLPGFLEQSHVAIVSIQMILTIIIMVINKKFFISGYKSLFKGAPNMDTLVALGASAAFGYSFAMLIAMIVAANAGNHELVERYMSDIYFESAGMILTLITVGKMLEARSKGKTTNALKALIRLTPKTATIIIEDKQKTVPAEDVKPGDIVLIKPGEAIPVDGRICEGSSTVNESAMTGESIPVDKKVGDILTAGTINQTGALKCVAEKTGDETALSQIIRMVSDAAATKAPIAKIADKVSGVFVPTVIAIAIVTTIIWLLCGAEIGYALARGISVLVISCPCALGLATPVAIMVGNGVAAKNGMLFKTAQALENTGKIKIVALDKTGTITKGEPEVTDVVAVKSRAELLKLAYSLESMSEHPLAKAIVKYCEARKIELIQSKDFNALTGSGLEARIGDIKITGGSERYIKTLLTLPDDIVEKSCDLATQGKTPMFFAKGDELLGIIAVADVIKPDSREAIKNLKEMGIKVVMLTGDNERTAAAIAAQAGIDNVCAEVLPDKKNEEIRKLQSEGMTIMVGDGINDAPALAASDIGMAIGAGTDVAIDSADVVLMKNSLMDVAGAIKLSEKTIRNIKENLFWAFIYNVIGIPLAAGVWIPIFGLELNPMFGAAAMSLSSFCVVSNALRLNLVKLNDEKENKLNTKTIYIEGMMCEHCERSVTTALLGVAGVTDAQASHEKGIAVVKIYGEVDEQALKNAVEANDYAVTSII